VDLCREELEPYLHQLAAERQQAKQRRDAEQDWQRHLRCTHLPDPQSRSTMNDYYSSLEEMQEKSMEGALNGCQVSCSLLLSTASIFVMGLFRSVQAIARQLQDGNGLVACVL
jgi:hypothetical protein